MGNACGKEGNVQVIEQKETAKLLSFSYDCDIHLKYHFLKVLNHGAFGQVKLYGDRFFEGAEYAIKTIPKKGLKKNQINNIINEIEILSSLDHPNIVKYFRTLEDYNNYYIIMEYLSGKDLEKIFKEDYNKLTFDDIRFILFQLLNALCYLHSKNIVHRDIKPANIICIKNNGKYDLKLIDFGLSLNLDRRGKSGTCGSLAFMAPEALKEIAHVKNDMWAIGVMLYWYIYGKFPFNELTRSNLANDIKEHDIEYDENLARPRTPKEAKDLMEQLLNKDFDERISAWDALKHPFFTKYEILPGVNSNYFQSFFQSTKVEIIRKYVSSNILKRAFLYMYSKFASYDEEEKVRTEYLCLEKNLENEGTISSHEVYEEFKKKNLLTHGDKKVFTEIDNIRVKSVKRYLSQNNSSSNNRKYSNKEQAKLKDWGDVSFSVFLSFHFLEEFSKEHKAWYIPRAKYIFELFSDEDHYAKKFTDVVIDKKMREEDLEQKLQNEQTEEHEYFIKKQSFLQFLYRFNLPFLEERDELIKFFNEHPENIDFNTFFSLIDTPVEVKEDGEEEEEN